MIARKIALCLLAASTCAAVGAESPKADEKLLSPEARGFLLDGPEIYKVHRRSNELIVEDLNGDGLADMAVASNEKGILELFLQKKNPEPGAPRFETTSIALDRIVRSMVATDVNGDGRVDILMSAAPNKLVVMYQGDDGRLGAIQDTYLEAERLSLGDLNNDGRDDVLVYTNKRFDLLPSEKRGIALEPSQTFYTTGNPARDPMIADFDGDGRNDIVYHDSSSFTDLVIRLQSAEKTFPAEFRTGSSVVRVAKAIQRKEKQPVLVAAINNMSRGLMALELAKAEKDETPGRLPLSNIVNIPFDAEFRSQDVQPVIADFDGDGRTDVLLYSPKLTIMRLFRQTKTGDMIEDRIPSFTGIESVTALPAAKGSPAPLIIFSPEEKAVGFTVFDPDIKTLPFPRVLPVAGEPLGVAVMKIDGKESLAAIVKEGSNPPQLDVYPLDNKGALGERKTLISGDSSLKSIEPIGLEPVDLNRDGNHDLVVFADFKPAVLLLQEKDGAFAELSATSGVLRGLLSGATPERFRVAYLDKDRKVPSAIVIKDKFARSFYIDEDKNVVIEHQWNGQNANSRIASIDAGSLRDGEGDVVVLDRGNKNLVIHGRQDGGDYEEIAKLDLDGEYMQLRVLNLDGDKRDDLLLLAEDRIGIVYTHPLNGKIESLATAKPANDEGGYGELYAGNILEGAPDEIMAVEMKDNLLDFFELGENEEGQPTLNRFYSFKMYDTDATIARRVNLDAVPEPREVVFDDLDGDGRNEIVTLTHDNIIIYTPVNPPKELARQ